MRMKDHNENITINTVSPLWVNCKPYCPFCGEVMESHIESECGHYYYDSYHYYTCKCSDFKKYEDTLSKIIDLKCELPREKFTIKTEEKLAKI